MCFCVYTYIDTHTNTHTYNSVHKLSPYRVFYESILKTQYRESMWTAQTKPLVMIYMF